MDHLQKVVCLTPNLAIKCKKICDNVRITNSLGITFQLVMRNLSSSKN